LRRPLAAVVDTFHHDAVASAFGRSRVIVDHTTVRRTLARLAVPIATAISADQLLGVADTIVIGSRGPQALAAIAAATSVFMTIAIALFAFASGPRIIGAQAIGAGDVARFGATVRASLVVPLAIVVVAIVLAALFAEPVLHGMLPHDPLAGDGARYLQLRAISLVPFVVSGIAIAAFGAAGDTTLGVRTLVAINLVHLPLLLVLALGLGSRHPLGLPGAGLASLCSELFGASYVLRAVARRADLGIFARRGIEPRLIRATAALSLPEFVFLAMLIVPEPICIVLLAPLGVKTVGAFRALSLVSDLTWALPGSLGEAMEIVLGQRLGARDVVGARAFLREARRLGVGVCAAAAIAVAILAWPLAALVTFDPAIATLAFAPLAAHVMNLPLKGYAMATLAPIRAAGDVRFTMLMGVATSTLAILGIVLGIIVLHVGLWSVPLGWTLAWVVRCTVTRLRLRGGDWERRRLAF